MHMKQKTVVMLIITTLVLSLTAFAQDYDDEKIDPKNSFYMILAGLAFLGIGSLISQAKSLESIGNIIKGIGLVIGGFGLLGIALIAFDWAVRTAITLVIYIGGLALAGYIFYQIYLALFGKKK